MRFILLLVAAVIAVIAGVAALQLTSKNAPVQTTSSSMPQILQSNVSTVDILIARTAIPLGTVITEAMVDKQPWPQHLVLEGFIISGSENANVVGKVARSSFLAREPLLASKLANPNDPSFLAAALPSGMVAVTIATDAVSGVAGYIFPGDRVDILLTHSIPQQIKASQEVRVNSLTPNSTPADAASRISDKPFVSEVLAPNVRILAVNVRDITGKEPTNATPLSMTVEVENFQAQKLRLAEKRGTLSVALRSLKDKDSTVIVDPTFIENLTRVQQKETLKVSR